MRSECPDCKGEGRIDNRTDEHCPGFDRCERCGGTGEVEPEPLEPLRKLAGLAGNEKVSTAGGRHAAVSWGAATIWLRHNGLIDLEIPSLTVREAHLLLRVLRIARRICGICRQPTERTDRVRHGDEPAHAACAIRAAGGGG